MGILSSITSTVSKAVSAVKTFAASKPLAFMNKIEGDLQSSPVKAAAVATGIIAAPAAISSLSTAAKAATPAVSSAVAAASPVVKSAAISAGTSTVKAIVANPIKATATVGAAIVGTNILASSSSARKAVVQAPSQLAVFGANIGKAIDNPTVDNILKIPKDSPLLTAAAIAGAAVIVGKAAGTAATIANTKALKEGHDIAKLPKPIGEQGLVSASLPSPATIGESQAEAVIAPKKKAVKKKKAKKKVVKKKKTKKKVVKKKKAAPKKKTKAKKAKKYIKKKKSKAKKKKK